jgi:hypothetical protein
VWLAKVLQEDLEKNHAFFKIGFHSKSANYVLGLTLVFVLPDHIVDHILTIYACGRWSDEIQAAYDRNRLYQTPSCLL